MDEKFDHTTEIKNNLDIWANPLLTDLQEHNKNYGYAKGEAFAEFTWIPHYLKNVRMGTESEEELFCFEAFHISYETLTGAILDRFLSMNSFQTKADWNYAVQREYDLLRNSDDLFPERVMENFLEAFFMIRYEWNEAKIDERRKSLGLITAVGQANAVYQEIQVHIQEKEELDRSVIQKLTCIPSYMRKTLLGIGDGGLSVYEEKKITLGDLMYEVTKTFLLSHDFKQQKTWIRRLAEEVDLIHQTKLFPRRIEECFDYALYDMAHTQNTEMLLNLRELYLQTESRQQESRFESFCFGGLWGLYHYPKSYDKKKKYPLVFFFHEETYRTFSEMENILQTEELKKHPFFRLSDEKADFPFITAAICLQGDSWFDRMETLMDLVRSLSEDDKYDKNRIYAIGADIGGYAVWQLGISMPRSFAAIIPICGGGMTQHAKNMKSLPIWAFHGEKDTITDVSETLKMTERVKACGGDVRVTIYPDMEHEIWENTFADTEIYKWLYSHEK